MITMKISELQNAVNDYIKIGDGRVLEIERTLPKLISSLTIADYNGSIQYYQNIQLIDEEEIVLNKRSWKIIQDVVKPGNMIEINRVFVGREFFLIGITHFLRK